MTRKKKIQEIWNPKTILTYFSNLGENQNLSFKHLTMKAIVLTMPFTACSFDHLVEGIRRFAKETLKEAGIPSHFTPYSIKAATLSTLTMSGIPPTQIAKSARLSPRTDTLVKHYVKANLASTLGKVIASTMNVPSEELANNPCAENGVKMCVRPDRDQKNKKERREMESGMVLRDKKR
ncbi:uncharacterized protein MONOS_11105 [Monocercomonoides exilis]|uniref:uncharacterized protein n=1 Tax=Monocercomonoides exilis TaxID=2049356 RepID=UPI00355956DF|nr:hypothetical protein MONOS_11105 [Monocercomonoides exilis]|eukprot:MONOS_11105.1-p1 / transcript=MONOS_11105.1 / gene=MONOS_11105 / organism=Monocercomonoides_exilis_PA203 / gene_product=unspecified product / transcript_product=unspecified product / location=Mono_scaffold00539:3603-4364(-) / protein_length=179 / sequence_SO=supercontig / SO=protein_coding / is_pseudo=false